MKTSEERKQKIKEIVGLSLRALDKMYYDNALSFCDIIKKDIAGKGPPSFRYTAITLLGLEKARRQGLPVLFPLEDMCTNLSKHAFEEENLGNKGLALWAALKLESAAADMALGALLAHDGLASNVKEGVVYSAELAWVVYSLAIAWADIKTQSGGILRRSMKDMVRERLQMGVQALRSQRNGKTGLFQCASITNGKGRFRDRMKTTSGFFNSQVYGAMALAQTGKALGRTDLLDEAHGTVRAILSRQGKDGDWPWHYDVRDGSIIDRYPIFSVHQDGMGPMVLLEVGEILGIDFQEHVERSLKWVFGANELNIPMVDWELGIIWRAVRRKGIRQYVLQGSRVAHHCGIPLAARLLRAIPGRSIEYECRPYHLGWVLYAFCRQSQLPPQGNSANDSPHKHP